MTSTLDWPECRLALTLDTTMPTVGDATLTIRCGGTERHAIARRLSGWATSP